MNKKIKTASSSKRLTSSMRLREMLTVLRKNGIVYGMTPVKLRHILEELGPTFVKLGQVISMRPNFLPHEYIYELTKLQTKANPLPFSTIKKILEEEYAQKWDDIFLDIDEHALGSASIAQVHRATLKENNQPVVVKVQRPGIYAIISQDIILLKRAVKLLQVFNHSRDVIDFTVVLDEMWTITKQEMDFMMEADHIEEFRHLNSDNPDVTCPQVIKHLTTKRILVMEYIEGIRIDNIPVLKQHGNNPEQLGYNLAKNYIKQIIRDGYFHADPHPGNLLVRKGVIVWLDLGMMGRLSQKERLALKKAMYSLAKHDTFGLKTAVLMLGTPTQKINHIKLYEELDNLMLKYNELRFEDLDLGKLASDILTILYRHDIAVNPGLSMFARGIMTIDGVMQIICPKINFVDIFKAELYDDKIHSFNLRDEVQKLQNNGYAFFYRSMRLPELLSDMIKMTMSGQTKVNLDLTGSEEPLKHMDSMINKLIIGIISSALLLSSSIICTTNMTPKFLEIPFLGAFGYLAALCLCAKLLWIIWRDR